MAPEVLRDKQNTLLGLMVAEFCLHNQSTDPIVKDLSATTAIVKRSNSERHGYEDSRARKRDAERNSHSTTVQSKLKHVV